MPRYLWSLCALLALAGLAGCSEDPPPPAPQPKVEERTPTVFDDQLKAMDTARDLKRQEEERLRQMDEQLNEASKRPQ